MLLTASIRRRRKDLVELVGLGLQAVLIEGTVPKNGTHMAVGTIEPGENPSMPLFRITTSEPNTIKGFARISGILQQGPKADPFWGIPLPLDTFFEGRILRDTPQKPCRLQISVSSAPASPGRRRSSKLDTGLLPLVPHLRLLDPPEIPTISRTVNRIQLIGPLPNEAFPCNLDPAPGIDGVLP